MATVRQGTSRHQSGVSLVEIMISLVLGLMVTGAVVQIYLTTRHQSTMQAGLTGRQESARFAAQLIQQDAQMAGFRGCLRDAGTVVNTLNNSTGFLYNFGQHVVGFDNAGGLPAALTNIVAGTDVLTLRTLDDPGALTLASDMPTNSSDPVIAAGLSPAPFDPGDFALVADCTGAAVFQVSAYDAGTGVLSHVAAGTPGNGTLSLGRRFGAGAQVFRMRTTSYYIRDSDNGTGPALWRRSGLNPPQELAEGIENMQVLYGEDTDGNQTPDVYRTADAVMDWGNVVSLEIALLAASTDGRVGDEDTRTFDLLGETVDPTAGGTLPSDGRLRRVVSFTIAMRNQLS